MRTLKILLALAPSLGACAYEPTYYGMTAAHPRYACTTGDMLRASASAPHAATKPATIPTDCNAHILHASIMAPSP